VQSKGKAGTNAGDDDEGFDGREDEDEAALNKKSVLLKGSVECTAKGICETRDEHYIELKDKPPIAKPLQL